MVGPKAFSVQLKEELLEYLLELTEDWDDDNPDIRVFWHTVERDFVAAKGTTWHGQDFEQKMEREEEVWMEECDDPNSKRRRGHEKGSNFDNLMTKWCAIWNTMLQKHWRFMVETGEERWELVPEEFQKNITRPTPLGEAPRPCPPPPPPPPPPQANAPSRYEYDGAKLQRVVSAAMERARVSGKHDLAAAVEQVYLDALQTTPLRVLLEAILTQSATHQQNEEFQTYVKLAKAKIKDAKEKKLREDEAAVAGKAQTAPTAAPAIAAPAAQVPPPASISPVVATPAPAPVVAPLVVAPAPAAISVAPIPDAVQTPVQTPVQAATVPATPVNAAPSTAAAMPPPSQPTSGNNGKAPAKTKAPAKSRVTKVTPKGKGKSPAKPSPATASGAGQLKPTQDAAPVSRIEAILGELQYVPSAQIILAASPDITDARLEALKKTMLSHPDTMRDIRVLEIRLQATLDADARAITAASRLVQADAAAAVPVQVGTGASLPTQANADASLPTQADASLPTQANAGASPPSQAVAGASRPARANAGKRRRTSDGEPTMAAAMEVDRLDAQRAAKRRRGEIGEDDGGDYHPLKAVRDKATGGKSRKRQKKSVARPSTSQSVATNSVSRTSMSRGSSPMSELSDEMDMESTKSAYVEELIARRTDQEAQRAIVERYGPVSPTVNGDADADDWTSMASPTLGAMHIPDDDADMQFDAEMQLEQRRPSPPPEPAPENNVHNLLAGATADAIARDPGIGRLEQKLDTLINIQNPVAAANGQTAAEMNATNTETLKDIAGVLRNADLSTTRPEFTRLILNLTHNAAEAAIHSAEASKKAGEMARDVVAIMQQLGVKGLAGGENPATPVSEN